MPTIRPFGRRELLRAGALAGGGLLLTACGATGPAPAPPAAGGWRFVDDTGAQVVTPARPRTVLCYLNVAGALWDHGYRCAATYSSESTPTPGDRSISGDLDPSVVPSFGESWGTLELEKVAAAQVDLVVLAMMAGSPLLTGEDIEMVGRLAPMLRLELHSRPLERTAARIAELAGALGDGSRPAAADDRDADFRAARDALVRTARAAAGLRVAFVAARPEFLSYDRTPDPTVRLATDLGLSVVDPGGGPADYSTKVSWEEVTRYPADLILLDGRPYSLKRDQLTSNVLWNRLPAVRAGQVASWNPEPVMSGRGLARAYRGLAAAIGGARRL